MPKKNIDPRHLENSLRASAFSHLPPDTLVRFSLWLQALAAQARDGDHQEAPPKWVVPMLLNREAILQILDCLPEGIQVADRSGLLQYVNSSFLAITGLKKEDRIGKNVHDVSPDGTLAKVLESGEAILNLRNHPVGTSVELLSSAAPLYINNHLVGAFCITKDLRDVVSLQRQFEKSKVLVKDLSEKIQQFGQASYTFDDIIGSSMAIQHVIAQAKIAAQTDTTVLIEGESGTGKEIIANAIHNGSARMKNPFVAVNCSAIPENLQESELFGHEKGAFTGALKRKLGKFEIANGGTLFLDEIGDMPLGLQAKMLRVLQSRRVQRIGSESEIQVDVRIVAATNRNLQRMIAEGTFREDLYYRLNIWHIAVPPLRERKADLDPLADFLLEKISRRLGRRGYLLSTEAKEELYRYYWHGNVRELENVLERTILVVNDRKQIEAHDLNLNFAGHAASPPEVRGIVPLVQMERQMIQEALALYGMSYEAKKQVAGSLGISLAGLYSKIKKYDL